MGLFDDNEQAQVYRAICKYLKLYPNAILIQWDQVLKLANISRGVTAKQAGNWFKMRKGNNQVPSYVMQRLEKRHLAVTRPEQPGKVNEPSSNHDDDGPLSTVQLDKLVAVTSKVHPVTATDERFIGLLPRILQCAPRQITTLKFSHYLRKIRNQLPKQWMQNSSAVFKQSFSYNMFDDDEEMILLELKLVEELFCSKEEERIAALSLQETLIISPTIRDEGITSTSTPISKSKRVSFEINPTSLLKRFRPHTPSKEMHACSITEEGVRDILQTLSEILQVRQIKPLDVDNLGFPRLTIPSGYSARFRRRLTDDEWRKILPHAIIEGAKINLGSADIQMWRCILNKAGITVEDSNENLEDIRKDYFRLVVPYIKDFCMEDDVNMNPLLEACDEWACTSILYSLPKYGFNLNLTVDNMMRENILSSGTLLATWVEEFKGKVESENSKYFNVSDDVLCVLRSAVEAL